MEGTIKLIHTELKEVDIWLPQIQVDTKGEIEQVCCFNCINLLGCEHNKM